MTSARAAMAPAPDGAAAPELDGADAPATESDGAAAATESPGRADPERRCIASGVVADRARLIRFVIGPDGMVTPDVDERLPGRGIWLSADRDLLHKAKIRNLFAKAARAAVGVPDDLIERVEWLLVRRGIETLGLARRAGQVVFGFERTREWLEAGRAGVIVEAADAAPGSRARLLPAGLDLAVVRSLTGDELGAAAGRDRTVHGAVSAGALAHRLIRDDLRLAGLRRDAAGQSAAAAMSRRSPQSCDE